MRDPRKSPIHKVIAKRVALWSAIGFFVPIFWGVMSFIFFNARQSRWTDLYWILVYITCPPWLLPENSWSLWITPIANAVLYGLIAFLISTGMRILSKNKASAH
jgi:hypothetical protein